MTKNPTYHSKTRHIEIKYHFVRHVIEEGGVSLEKVHTPKNCVDMFTKPMLVEKLKWFVKGLIHRLGQVLGKLLSRWRLLDNDNN